MLRFPDALAPTCQKVLLILRGEVGIQSAKFDDMSVSLTLLFAKRGAGSSRAGGSASLFSGAWQNIALGELLDWRGG
jgi:hypothetical protein